MASTLAGAGGLLLPGAARAGSGAIHRQSPNPLRILFLGGTDFVGPAIVDVAIERGHEVTLFNRGMTNPWLYTHLERLVGNRYPDRGPGLGPLAGDRRWDAVIDTWQDSPVAVELTAKLLRDRVDAYVYISSIAVYQAVNYRQKSFDETAEPPPAEMPESIEVELPYPVRKQLGEEAVAGAFPGRHMIPRAYGIVGTDARGHIQDPKGAYWPMRLRRGGDVLAPGDGEDRTQWTDVRDLAEFTVHAIEEEVYGGAYNVSRGATFREFLTGLASLSPDNVEAELTWVPAEFLLAHDLRSWSDVPGWIWRHEREPGFYYASTEKARAAGLRHRSITDTMRPVVDAFLRHHEGFDFGDPETGFEIARREEEILALWHAREAALRG